MGKYECEFGYISNAGIVFLVDEKLIGIDCLCKDTTKLYQDTPMEIREELNLDVLIFTHEHEDHFCAEYVRGAWKKNPKLQIYSTKQVVEHLERVQIPTAHLNQVQDGTTLDIGGLQITFIKTAHEGEQYADVKNLTLLVKVEDKHLVVTGDAMPCKELFERIAEWSLHIDWLLAPFPYIGLRSTRKLICENLNVKNIFVLHQPRPESDTQNWVANTKKVCELAKDGLPSPIFPEKLGDWYRLT